MVEYCCCMCWLIFLYLKIICVMGYVGIDFEIEWCLIEELVVVEFIDLLLCLVVIVLELGLYLKDDLFNLYEVICKCCFVVVDEVDCWFKLECLDDVMVLLVLYLLVKVKVEVECVDYGDKCLVVFGGEVKFLEN